MRDFKWTLGPWIANITLIGGDPDINRREVYGTTEDRLFDSRHYGTRSICRLNEFLHTWTPEDQANLKLILASPELAVAMIGLVEAVDSPIIDAPPKERLNNALIRARAALKSAGVEDIP